VGGDDGIKNNTTIVKTKKKSALALSMQCSSKERERTQKEAFERPRSNIRLGGKGNWRWKGTDCPRSGIGGGVEPKKILGRGSCADQEGGPEKEKGGTPSLLSMKT